MDRYDYLLDSVPQEFTSVRVLKDSQRSRVELLRHEKTGKPYIFRQFAGNGEVYRRLMQVNCPHLPQVLKMEEKDGRVAVLEEYIPGEDLGEMLETALFSEQEVRAVARDVLRGLGVLHSLGIVHRDIKPENVVLRDTGAVLIDFDASRLFKRAQSDDTHVLGTTGYAAPEQFGVAQTDYRADIYAMGILMNMMLTGQHPSKAMAGGSMGKIISRCTMMDPGRRYKDTKALLRALGTNRKKVLLPALAAAMLLLAAVFILAFRTPETGTVPTLAHPSESPTPSPAVSLAPSPEPTPQPIPSEAPVETTPFLETAPSAEPASLAEATYVDEDGEYRLFLCFDAPAISQRWTQESRVVELPPGANTNVPSILTVYREGSVEDVSAEFAEKVARFSVEAIPAADAYPMGLTDFVEIQEFAGSLRVVAVSMGLECRENTITWTLNMVDGQVLTLRQTLTVQEAESVSITPENVDMSTLEQLQNVIDSISNDVAAGTPVDIYLPPVTYEGDLRIRYRGINLIGDPAGSVLRGTVTVDIPTGERVTLKDLVLEGQGGTGVTAHAPVTLINCTLSGYDIAAAAYDGGWLGAQLSAFRNNGVGICLDSAYSAHVDVGYPEDLFEDNQIAIQIHAIGSDASMIFPGTVFSGNGQDIDNQIGYPVDTADAVFQ